MSGAMPGLPITHALSGVSFTLMYSSTLKTDYQSYHEVIHRDDIDVAKIIEEDGTYGFILDHNMSRSRGYKTVADCKKILFLVLDSLEVN